MLLLMISWNTNPTCRSPCDINYLNFFILLGGKIVRTHKLKDVVVMLQRCSFGISSPCIGHKA